MRKPWMNFRLRSASWPVILLAPLLMGVTSPRASFNESVLAAQNQERVSLGLRALRWNDDLAMSAQSWADYLAANNTFEHAPAALRSNQGENLWRGTQGYYAPEDMVDAWLRQKAVFVPGVFPHNSTTGRVTDVGHYTQVVWRSTREVGCAMASSATKDVLVCRYAEHGNTHGKNPY